MGIRIDIDESSGFCSGVIRAVRAAENKLAEDGRLYSLGDLVHNHMELDRLKAGGLESISCEELASLSDNTVLIRAHGEPPETYEKAEKQGVSLIDATCPIVLRLQQKISETQKELGAGGSILIYGKAGHPEVRSLVGHSGGKARVMADEGDLADLKLDHPIHLFSQTTMPVSGFTQFQQVLISRLEGGGLDPDRALVVHDTICRQVADRDVKIRRFAKVYDLVVFVSGKESSNGKALYEVCRAANPRSFFVSEPSEIRGISFRNVESIGICGATSSPLWLLEKVKEELMSHLNITGS